MLTLEIEREKNVKQERKRGEMSKRRKHWGVLVKS